MALFIFNNFPLSLIVFDQHVLPKHMSQFHLGREGFVSGINNFVTSTKNDLLIMNDLPSDPRVIEE